MAVKGRALPAAVRVAVSHEADMEAIRRADLQRQGQTPLPAGAGAGPMELDPNQQQQGQWVEQCSRTPGAHTPGVVPLTLAERMKAAAAAAGARAGLAGARPGGQQQPRQKQQGAVRKPGTWLDQLKEQRQRGGAVAGGSGGAAGGAASGKGRQRFPVLYKYNEVRGLGLGRASFGPVFAGNRAAASASVSGLA